ncbi:MAG: nonstructural protein [Arizlama microvirus]|nr:MAG: nonstructural protein [Arizlama microvirus]
MKLYSVYDKRAREFGSPMAMPTDAHAVRSFTQEVNREDTGNMLNQFPEDFAIYHVGDFNQELGQITGQHNMLLEGVAAKRPGPPTDKKRG